MNEVNEHRLVGGIWRPSYFHAHSSETADFCKLTWGGMAPKKKVDLWALRHRGVLLFRLERSLFFGREIQHDA